MRGKVFGNVTAKAVRTYNYKRMEVIDHRTGIVLPLRNVLDGKIQPFIDASSTQNSTSLPPKRIANP